MLIGGLTAVLLASGGSVFLANQLASTAQAGATSESRRVDSQLAAARAAGYSDEDLRPVQDRLRQIRAAGAPLLLFEQPGFYGRQAADLNRLEGTLRATEVQVDQNVKQDLDQQLAAARSGIDHDTGVEVMDSQISGFAARWADLGKREAAATTIADVRRADTEARALVSEVTSAGSQQEAENAAIQAAADALAQQGAGVATLHSLGNTALASGRNDAAVAAYEAKPGRFAPLSQLLDAYNRMERYASRVASSDLKQATFGTAAVQRYGGRVHDLLIQNLGPKHIIVSFEAQHVWVYEGPKVVLESAVTTGIRGAGPYGTDFGPMKVLHSDHPWKMHSPWPKGSIYWYPDTMVQWTVFFTDSGESFHDASWEADSQLGPGSQYDPSTRSHGCIHVPYSDARWLYGWADVGTPVDVVPGDGQPLATQLAEMTTDDQGVPLNPA